ncbi:MAG: VCBS repeat-containing protein, partial [Planctomycetota bacterium]|nr:VCBS repeat-containing protein [Planctomycetota bacterium]
MNARRVVPWACCSLLLLPGCGADTPAASQDGHARMVALLADFARQTVVDNTFFGTRTLERDRAELAKLGRAAPWRLHLDVGTGELRLGREREGITVLAAARQAMQAGTLAGDTDAAVAISFHLGVGWMRLAETENCCASPTHETCILPIQGTGVHQKKEGATNAAHCFTEVLQNTAPGSYWHLTAQWLLNVAHMTLGTFPDGVPERYRLPAKSFAPERDFPRFVDVAPAVGLDTFGLAGGACVDDFDGDEYLDVVASDWSPTGQMHFFHNQRDGTFADRTQAAGLVGITGGL